MAGCSARLLGASKPPSARPPDGPCRYRGYVFRRVGLVEAVLARQEDAGELAFWRDDQARFEPRRHTDRRRRRHRLGDRGVLVQRAQRRHRRREHLQLTRLPARQRVARAHPQAGDRLGVVVQRLLRRRGLGHEEAGVESSRFADRRQPVGDELEPRRQQHESLGDAQLDERSLPVVDAMARGVEALGDRRGRRTRPARRRPRAGRAARRPPRSTRVSPPRTTPGPAVEPESLRGGGIVEPVAHRLEVVAVVGVVDPPAGEHVLAARERRRVRALQHEHLEPAVTVAQQHHRRRRSHRDIGSLSSVPSRPTVAVRAC